MPFVERTDAHETEPCDGHETSTEEAGLALPMAEKNGSHADPVVSAQPSPPALVNMLVLFFFLYVGAEVGFGAWVAVVVLRDDLATEAGAALMARYGVREGMKHGARQMGRIPLTRTRIYHLFFVYSEHAQTVVTVCGVSFRWSFCVYNTAICFREEWYLNQRKKFTRISNPCAQHIGP